jgi:hypothetical protein
MAQITLNSSGVASNGALALQSNGTTTAVTIDTAQNVGVGVTPSAWGSGYKVIQVGDSAFSNFGTGYVLLTQNALFGASSNTYINTAAASYYRQFNGSHAFFTAASGTAGNTISFTQAMTLDASGYLLVGATSSDGVGANRLQVGQSGATAGILIKNSSGHGALYSTGTDLYQTWASGGFLALGHAPANGSTFTEYARITSAGEFLVGATSKTGSGASEGKQVIRFAGATENGLYLDDTRTSSGTDNVVVFGRGATAVGQITTTTTSTSYVTSSDYRLKENVAPMTGALEKVLELNPVTYTWKVDGSAGEGFIAHELQAVVPDAVSGEKDGEEMQGVDYSKITPLLTAALQEAITKIETLEARIAVLEKK